MSSATQNRALRILVIENHADTLQSLKLYLEESGHQVSTAMTIAQARALLEAKECDVLICDIGLPDGNGWELYESIKQQRPIFAVAMSGFGQNADSARSRTAGFRYHLLKPFRAAEIDKILSEAAAEKDAGENRI
jgi:CheY-like chemotaxis protein